MTSNLEKSDLGLEPQIELDLGEGLPMLTAQLAGQLELADRLKARHRERRKVVGLRLSRQFLIQEFKLGIRGIVRIAQGISGWAAVRIWGSASGRSCGGRGPVDVALTPTCRLR